MKNEGMAVLVFFRRVAIKTYVIQHVWIKNIEILEHHCPYSTLLASKFILLRFCAAMRPPTQRFPKVTAEKAILEKRS